MNGWTATARQLWAAVILCVPPLVLWPTGHAAAQPLSGVAQGCPVGSPTASQVIPSLGGGLAQALDTAWKAKAPASIDPYPPYPPGTLTPDKVINGIPLPADKFCNGKEEFDLTTFCQTKGYLNGCYSGHANITLNQVRGLGALSFGNMVPAQYDLKDVAAHSNAGPDASKLTDGVFAPPGHSSGDPEYAIVLPHSPNDPRAGIVVDLGALYTVCGNGFDCKSGPILQADNDDDYQLDYSTNGVNWQPYGVFQHCCDSGLQKRGIATITSGVHNPNFKAQYLRVYAIKGGATFAVSELQLWDSGSHLISVGKKATGPRPYQITTGTPPKDGTSAGDSQYSVLLSHETGPAPALMVDLGVTSYICGNGYDCVSGPMLQADNDDDYQLDYSNDGVNWTGYGQFPHCCDSNLRTRGIATITAGVHNPSFKARYLRVYANGGGDHYSVSQLELWDVSSKRIGIGAATFGPEPVITNGEKPNDGTDYSDTRFAMKLAPCKTNTTDSVCPTSTALTGAQTVDLAATFPIDHLVIQADQAHAFQVEYLDNSTQAWKALWTVSQVSGTHLQTRTSQAFSPQPSARYLRIYGTAGAVDSFAISAIQVFTAQANTACGYDAGANTGENFACSYDGQYATQLILPPGSNSQVLPTTLPVNFFIKNVEIVEVCQGGNSVTGYYYGSYVQKSATNRNCTDEFAPVPPPKGGNPRVDFCGGFCPSGPYAGLLSYAHLPGENLADPTNPTASQEIQFASTNPNNGGSISCDGGSIDSSLLDVADGVVADLATQLVQGLFDGLLDYRKKPNALVPFPQPNPQTTPPSYSVCTALTSAPPPPGPYPDTISGVEGRATQVGTGVKGATLHISGLSKMGQTIALDQIAVSVDALLHEFRGGGELVQTDAETPAVPVALQSLPGSKPDSGLYATPAGVKPSVRLQLSPAKGPGSASGMMQFTIDVSGAEIASPSRCAEGSSVAPLGTSFLLIGSTAEPVWIHAIAEWQCGKSQLITSIGQ